MAWGVQALDWGFAFIDAVAIIADVVVGMIIGIGIGIDVIVVTVILRRDVAGGEDEAFVAFAYEDLLFSSYFTWHKHVSHRFHC